jgi:hypothetical protein
MTSSSSSPSMRALDLNSLGSVGSMTSIQEYNLQQLASLAGKAECQNSIQQHHHLQQHQRQQAGLPPPRGTPSPHTTSPFTLADLLAGDMNVTSHAFTNLQALAKLGSHTLLIFFSFFICFQLIIHQLDLFSLRRFTRYGCLRRSKSWSLLIGQFWHAELGH